MNLERRKQFNERFLQRLLARRPQDRPEIEQRLQQEERRVVPESAFEDLTLDPTGQIRRDPRDLALETIVNRERPVLFVRDGQFDLNEVTALGPEAVDLVDRMKQQGNRLFSVLPLIGRIDVVNFPNVDYVGTGWFVDTDIVVTNRHVASLIARWDGRKFAFTRGIGGLTIESSFCNAHEFDDLTPDASRMFNVTEVLYIERDGGHDIAFLKVDRHTDGRGPSFISVAESDAADEVPVCVIGYPARAPKRVIPDQELMKQLYRDRFDVKRAAPGFTSGHERDVDDARLHDAWRELRFGRPRAGHGTGGRLALRRHLRRGQLRGPRVGADRLHPAQAMEHSAEYRDTPVGGHDSAVGAERCGLSCEWRPFGQHHDSHHRNSDGRHAADSGRVGSDGRRSSRPLLTSRAWKRCCRTSGISGLKAFLRHASAISMKTTRSATYRVSRRQ